ncbi:hypothetical protein NC651_009055 [Populus alba x Populus x berolinensis]|nr:hypothetical protein NC651_009055 [Populus alba x Populus x berolinensis]
MPRTCNLVLQDSLFTPQNGLSLSTRPARVPKVSWHQTRKFLGFCFSFKRINF